MGLPQVWPLNVKQKQPEPPQQHSEQRIMQPPLQHHHSPEVQQPGTEQPPPAHPSTQVGHGSRGETQSGHGPPPHPTHGPGSAIDTVTPLRVRARPTPSEPAVMKRKKSRLDDFSASLFDRSSARSNMLQTLHYRINDSDIDPLGQTPLRSTYVQPVACPLAQESTPDHANHSLYPGLTPVSRSLISK